MPDIGVLVALLATLAVAAIVMLLGYLMIVAFARVLHRDMPALSPPRETLPWTSVRTRLASGEDPTRPSSNRLRSVLLGR